MGFLDALIGNASEIDPQEVSEELSPILSSNESVERVYKEIRDMYVFTSKRLILIDKQGLTGKKVEYHSVPYKSITNFKVETAGHFDMDAEFEFWISGQSESVKKELKKDTATGIQQTLADFMFA